MEILLTNDDGVYSPGIQILALKLTAAGHRVVIMAPDRERSACGHSMTLEKPVCFKRVDRNFLYGDIEAYACDGTPTDCVTMAYDVLGIRPDFLISGINQGPNLGDDLTYSGTACGAMEGIIFGIPSLAVSLDIRSKKNGVHNSTAAEVTVRLLEKLAESPMEKGVFYNVNVPNVPFDELKGTYVTVRGRRIYEDRIKVVKSPFGKEAYWIGGRIVDDPEEGTDVWAVGLDAVSIAPVQMDMTAYAEYNRMKNGNLEKLLEN